MKQQVAKIYITIIAALGLVVLVASSTNVRTSAIDPVMFVVILALVGVAQRNPVVLFRSSSISVAFAVKIAAYVLFGTPVALWATVVVVAVNAYTPKPKPARKIIFNFGGMMVSTYLASTTYQLVGGMVPPGAFVPTMLAVAVSAAVYFAVNSVLTAAVITLTSSSRFVDVWMQNFAWMPVNYLATAVNGAALALAYQSLGVIGVIVFVLPLGIAWYSFRLYMMKSTQVRERNRELVSLNENLHRTTERLEASHVSVIAALLGSLAAKERSEGHSDDTMQHALAVAKSLGLGPDEIAAVNLGTLFHDIGKIGIPEHILQKPTALTDVEWAEMKTHPVIGANLIGEVPNLERIRPIVLAHHEHYDGTGYPNGLKGDEIPLAAQIISVADTYEAMTSTRPYRPALSHADAVAELRRVAGSQLNPIVVEAFIRQVEIGASGAPHTHDGAAHSHVRDLAVAAARLSMH
ncbi:MAG TPA: HD-GYP domain-containing protein [Candidatus Limnocylindria bacterium]|nr:HD-GYP domain-containing protein [Candidatus Limnocylindria bacterium]